MPSAPSNDEEQGKADLLEGGGAHEQHEERDTDVVMDDVPEADAEAEHIPLEKTIEAEAKANDASQTAQAPRSSAEMDQAAGQAAYKELERASNAGDANRAMVQVQRQPKQAQAPPKPADAGTSSTERPL